MRKVVAHSGLVVSLVLSVRPSAPHEREPRPLAYAKQTGSDRENLSRSRSPLRTNNINNKDLVYVRRNKGEVNSLQLTPFRKVNVKQV